MARQQKLLASLDTEPADAKPTLSQEAQAAQLSAEQVAIDAAFAQLAEGRLDAALGLLTPHADAAQDPRTLTTLSRILSMQGQFDEALALLLRAEQLAPSDPKVVHFIAELLKVRGRYAEEVHYRRRAAFTTASGPGEAYVHLATALVKATAPGQKPPLSELRLALTHIRGAPDLSPELRAEAARTLFAVSPLTRDAVQLYVEADPPAADKHDVVANWHTLSQWCAQSHAPLHPASAFGMAGRRPSLAQLTDTILLPAFQWLPLLQDGRAALSGLAASRTRTHSEDPTSPLLMASPRKAIFRLPRDLPTLSEPVIVLGGNGNYYHDLVEYLGALAIPETLGLGSELRLLVNGNVTPHQTELLALLGIGPERQLLWDPTQPVRLAQHWLPTRLAAGGRWFDPLLPHWYRQRFAHCLSDAAPTRRLYLSRAGASRRHVLNENEVLRTLRPFGFECVHPEALSVREQVLLFSQAAHVVAPSGAALTNMLFMPPGGRVLIIQNRHLLGGSGDLYFDALAQACGHHARIEACRPGHLASGQRSIDADIVVDCQQLAAACAELTSSDARR